MGVLTGLLYACLAVFAAGWYFNKWSGNFSLLLFVLSVVTFGYWIRSVHRFAAHFMVAAVFLHLVRVFLTGAYKNGPGHGQHREWNWLMGIVMLLLSKPITTLEGRPSD